MDHHHFILFSVLKRENESSKTFKKLFCRKKAVKLKKLGKAMIGTGKSGKEGKREEKIPVRSNQ